jgi:sec-independent protein translocase protein TatB
MFDIGFSELIVIGIVALVVIGPERLPRVARTTGLLLGRLQRYVADVKADIGRELQLEELKKLQAEVQESAHDLERSMTDEMRSIERDVGQAIDSIKADALSDKVTDGTSPPADKR